MIENRYAVEFETDFTVFEFDSEGPKGKIRKVVQYSKIGTSNFYNLGFGDQEFETNSIDDLVVTNNHDRQKVLATVASTLFVFTEHYPEALVVAVGSTPARTRLYRIGITIHLEAIEKEFVVYGFQNGDWRPFKKGVEYPAFLVKRKS